MVTVFHYTPVNAKQFDGLNIDGLAGKRQKRQNFPLYGININTYCQSLPLLTMYSLFILSTEMGQTMSCD